MSGLKWSHLLLKEPDGGLVGGAVMSLHRGLVQQELVDLRLQIGVGPLQGAHLLQVAAQAVVQVLHGGLLRFVDVQGVRQLEA